MDTRTIIILVVGGLGLLTAVLLLIMFIAIYQNNTKEKWRCRECGFLANANGTEEAIVNPQFKESTYNITEETGRQWHKEETYTDGEDLKTRNVLYAEIHITESCKKCKALRRQYKQTRRRSAY